METRLIPAVLVLLVFAGCINIPICNKPYIPVGQGCCLDTNDNNICDTDETTTTYTPITSSSTTMHTTTTTRVCKGEGEVFDSGWQYCCQGLSGLYQSSINESGSCVVRMDPHMVCAYCGNGICGAGETECNCPSDCARQTTTTTTSTTTTSTSTTTTTQNKLPVSEVDYMAHISGSEEYQELQKVYDEDELRMGVGSRTYEFVKKQLEYVEKEYNMTKSCLGCFDFSRGLVWVAEFGSEDVAYMNALDRETGTGATYRYARKTNKYTCWCDSI